MARYDTEVTYLELRSGTESKFYEVTIADTSVAVRYGRIGATGKREETAFADRAAAEAFANKKLAEKRKKGYASPSQSSGGSMSAASAPRVTSVGGSGDRAPVLWEAPTGAPGFGLFVDEARCYAGNQAGDVYVLDHEGALQTRFTLPRGVKCLIGDEAWRYAGCDDGNVYELGGRAARLSYEIEADANLFWLDVRDGVLFVSDNAGHITAIDHESERLWSAQSEGRAGWMARADERAVYHGHSGGITAYARRDGRVLWEQRTGGAVMFGWQEDATLYVATNQKRVEAYDKTAGAAGPVFACDATVYSCAAAPGGRYVFAADNCSWVYCFAPSGERLWKLRVPGDPAYSMQYAGERLYLVSTSGVVSCLDASERAITAARRGAVPTARRATVAAANTAVQVPVATRGVAPGDAAALAAESATRLAALPVASDSRAGVVLECVRGEGGRLRVRVVSPGYDPAMHCQFPRDLRVEGARYVVDAVRASSDGGFYRTLGEIKRLA